MLYENNCQINGVVFKTIDINACSFLRGREGSLPSSRLPLLLHHRSLQDLPYHPFQAFPFLPFLPFRAFPCRPFLACLQNLSGEEITLHLGGIKASKSFFWFFSFFIFIDPLGPIDLDVLIFVLGLEQSWPEWCGWVLLLQYEDEVEAGLGPLGGSLIDRFIEFKGEGILLAIAFSNKCEGGLCEFDVVVLDVPQLHLQVHAFFPLRPLGDWMTAQIETYSMVC